MFYTPGMESKHIWPAVVLVGLVVAGVVTLSALKADLQVIKDVMAILVVPLLLALVGSQVSIVKQQTNGNLTKLLEQLARSQEIIASTPPSPLATPDRDGPTEDPSTPR